MSSRRLVLLPLVLVALGGCATKGDLRNLRTELQAARSSQEAQIAQLGAEIRQEIQRQGTLLRDTMNAQNVRLRGDLSNRLSALERQLITIQELTGQGQQGLAQLRESLRAQDEALRAATAAAATSSAGGSTAGGAGAPAGDPDEVFSAAKDALDRGSLSTARAGFEEFSRSFPQHARAAEALLYIGQAREKAKEADAALEAYRHVVELHPTSPQAATALYRSALIEIPRGNRTRARTLLNQLATAYPRSPEATLAKDQLKKLKS
jgi:tol-pal system protein YbgF